MSISARLFWSNIAASAGVITVLAALLALFIIFVTGVYTLIVAAW